MTYIEAPEKDQYSAYPSIFLAGSITGASEWQSIFVDEFKDEKVKIFNPRRKSFDVTNPSESATQIEWEYTMLRRAGTVMFYFAHETNAPITLFELGATMERNIRSPSLQNILIFCEDDYSRKQDVYIQTSLINSAYRADGNGIPEVLIFTTFKHLIEHYRKYIHDRQR